MELPDQPVPRGSGGIGGPAALVRAAPARPRAVEPGARVARMGPAHGTPLANAGASRQAGWRPRTRRRRNGALREHPPQTSDLDCDPRSAPPARSRGVSGMAPAPESDDDPILRGLREHRGHGRRGELQALRARGNARRRARGRSSARGISWLTSRARSWPRRSLSGRPSWRRRSRLLPNSRPGVAPRRSPGRKPPRSRPRAGAS